jgi:hypothetical protein
LALGRVFNNFTHSVEKVTLAQAKAHLHFDLAQRGSVLYFRDVSRPSRANHAIGGDYEAFEIHHHPNRPNLHSVADSFWTAGQPSANPCD